MLAVRSLRYANVTVTVPGAPTSVAATAGNAQNTITWSAPSSGGTPTSYNLYWKTSDMGSTCSSGTKITGVTSPDVITSLTNGTTYYYMLTAANSAGEGACSTEVNATPYVATNYLNDSAIVGAWSFENNLNDSTSNGNTLAMRLERLLIVHLIMSN